MPQESMALRYSDLIGFKTGNDWSIQHIFIRLAIPSDLGESRICGRACMDQNHLGTLKNIYPQGPCRYGKDERGHIQVPTLKKLAAYPRSRRGSSEKCLLGK